ncbi:MAG: Uncharacterised protein [Prochlorococcus marinus str. MIT 9215]|nr:MAG: Uncharacterised protein [Prochlorococcus marinus str. MIT 9215]
MEGHRQQSNRDLFTRGQQHVHFPLWWIAADRLGKTGEFVSGVAHGRDHDHQVMPLVFAGRNLLGYGLDALHTSDGSAAEFLHQQRHPSFPGRF